MLFEESKDPEAITEGNTIAGVLKKIAGVLEPDIAAQIGFMMYFVTVAEPFGGIACPLGRNGLSGGGDRIDDQGACCPRDGKIGYVPSIPAAQHQRQTGPGDDERIEIEEAANVTCHGRPEHRKADASDRASRCKRECRYLIPDAGQQAGAGGIRKIKGWVGIGHGYARPEADDTASA
ncbi:hypothetical protein CRBSH125_36600 [Afipia carboxidovorans]|nr:hypothetical protein CRBSH125_36600 [Afipia carboxidovorans]